MNFQLAVLPIITTIAGFQAPVRDTQAEEEAVAVIEEHGGSIDRDPTVPGQRVVGARFAGHSSADEDVKFLRTFTELRYVSFIRSNVTDAGFKQIGAFTQGPTAEQHVAPPKPGG